MINKKLIKLIFKIIIYYIINNQKMSLVRQYDNILINLTKIITISQEGSRIKMLLMSDSQYYNFKFNSQYEATTEIKSIQETLNNYYNVKKSVREPIDNYYDE